MYLEGFCVILDPLEIVRFSGAIDMKIKIKAFFAVRGGGGSELSAT